jgi:methionine synthase / methylenetetrahydrofolate reductase(NADPH)
MTRLAFRQRLAADRPILADGAMGTQLHERGALPIDGCFVALNLTRPELVRDVHMAYIAAGAELIETNTFDANRFKLTEHGLAHSVVEINDQAVRIAREAVRLSGRTDVYIAGSVGPLGVRIKPYGRTTQAEARAAFAEQVGALVHAGVDAILLETFANHDELLLAVGAVRAAAPAIPLIAQATFSRDGLMATGYTPARIANDLLRSGVDIIGANCGTGPSQLAAVLQAMQNATPRIRLSAMPNAGYPEVIGGRAMYPATADYFGDYARTFQGLGAHIIGGCCGTGPEHIRAMRAALDDPRRAAPEVVVVGDGAAAEDAAPPRPTDLAARLAEGRFTINVEMAPPRSFSAEDMLRNARLLREAGADLIDVADTPAAKMKMSAWAACHLIQTGLGMETVLHFPTRGRNILRVQGDLLAAHALDLRNLFVTMGDPTRIGDYPEAMDNYDIVPSKLIHLIKGQMNAGVDMAGNSIGRATAFTVGCALNMGADDIDHEIRVLRRKRAAGADFAIGQAVFEPHKIEAFLRRYEEIEGVPFDLPVLLGVIPLLNPRHAGFLHNEVPGITIPDAIFARMEAAGDDSPAEGVRIAKAFMDDVRGMVAGAYIIPAFGRFELAADLIDHIAYPGRARV